MNSFNIGKVKINGQIVLGPMAGVTDLPFRVLCKEFGADLIYTEMVSAKGIMYDNRNTKELLETKECERPVAIQLFGNDPQIISEQAKRIEELPFDILDINMGCPVPKVVGNGEGSALMKNPKLIGEIVEATSKATCKPVTIKIRKGFNDEQVNAVEVAHIAEESGAAAVAVHGRTREQGYEGIADWDIIAKVKERVKIPVIGSGDAFSPEKAKKMLDETGCDGVMFARGVRGNPWLLSHSKHYIETGIILPKPPIDEVIRVMLLHAEAECKYKGGDIGIREMRKHVAWYLAGYPNSARMRAKVNEINSMEELEELLNDYRSRLTD